MNMPLYGLVLAGGESSRMEQEKSEIPYHGVPQVRFCVELLSEFCEKVYLSCRKDKIPSDGTSYFLDDNPGEGPAGGLKPRFGATPTSRGSSLPATCRGPTGRRSATSSTDGTPSARRPLSAIPFSPSLSSRSGSRGSPTVRIFCTKARARLSELPTASGSLPRARSG
jgi:hypothetical protein